MKIIEDIKLNIGKCLQCNTCSSQIDCRIGMSNRGVQPFQFACPVCEEVISFEIGSSNEDLLGAEEIDSHRGFGSALHFIDLHLDFPVSFGKYEQGKTAYMKAVQELGDGFFHLSAKLDMLNKLHPYQRDLERLITQYKRGDIKAFGKVCDDVGIQGIELKSQKKQDVLAALYAATSVMSSPFTIHENNEELSERIPELLVHLKADHEDKLNEFYSQINESGFLRNLHHDCLSLYPKILALDLPLRSGLYFDYTETDNIGNVPARVSTSDFDTCSNYYKDLAEVFSRQLVILAGLNNLLKRGDFDQFDDEVSLNRRGQQIREFSSLDKFADVDLGRKLDAINDSFYSIETGCLDNKLRNGIAHYKYEYHQSTQLITYYSGKEGMKRERFYELYFIEFMRKTLLLFREVHNMNHIIKALLYFQIFILD